MTFCNDDDDDVMMYYLISPTTEKLCKFKLQNDEFTVYIMSMCLNCMFKQQCLGLLSVFYSHMHNDITATMLPISFSSNDIKGCLTSS